MSDTIKIDNLIENMQELEVIEEPVVKEKRRYRSKFHDMTEEQIKQHKAEVKRKSNINYKLNHYERLEKFRRDILVRKRDLIINGIISVRKH